MNTTGFHLERRRISGGSGGGGGGTGEQVRWARDLHTQVVAWVGGALVINLSQTPMDTDGLTVWAQGQILHPLDYTILTGPNRVQINFGLDPAAEGLTDYRFIITYPYLL